eukprot:TRINITY_DN22785_c0_g1_i2.p1 TRINITY_DN22785_c0_g1~~TRINITY_DN22785_c0_g1_i2.p1  ORF type:complete len:312 (+),score=41.26 TRINITY_DN22785_c0_g1_i2:64-999(+)
MPCMSQPECRPVDKVAKKSRSKTSRVERLRHAVVQSQAKEMRDMSQAVADVTVMFTGTDELSDASEDAFSHLSGSESEHDVGSDDEGSSPLASRQSSAWKSDSVSKQTQDPSLTPAKLTVDIEAGQRRSSTHDGVSSDRRADDMQSDTHLQPRSTTLMPQPPKGARTRPTVSWRHRALNQGIAQPTAPSLEDINKVFETFDEESASSEDCGSDASEDESEQEDADSSSAVFVDASAGYGRRPEPQPQVRSSASMPSPPSRGVPRSSRPWRHRTLLHAGATRAVVKDEIGTNCDPVTRSSKSLPPGAGAALR